MLCTIKQHGQVSGPFPVELDSVTEVSEENAAKVINPVTQFNIVFHLHACKVQ